MAELSYVHGASGERLIGKTIGQAFEEMCQARPAGLALISRHQDVRWSWAELKARVDAFAAGLLDLGLEPGDRIGVWAPNCWEWVVTQFATARAGLVLVNINPAYRLSEAEYALNKVGCRALVTAVRHKTSEYLAMVRELRPRLPRLEHVITTGEEVHADALAFADVLARTADRDRLEAVAARLQFDDAINIQFTSGTTGFPKGATLSHHNILNNGHFVGRAIGLQAGEKVCIPVPLYHCFGMVMGNLACVAHGATMVFPAEAFDPLAVLETVEAERCQALYGVPTMFIAALGHPEFERFDLTSLRTGIMAGSPCPIEVMKQVISRMHMPEVTIAYGMTETSPVSFQSGTDDSLERRVSTVGRIQPHLEVKIVDAEGRIVPRGEPGELCTRGYSVMIGYWDDPEKTAEAIDAGGWMHTGDLAVIDDEGFCNIVGRIKDMVIRGGENIYPREIEEYLYRHPAIQDVQVIGVPDPKYGEELCAWIVLKPGEALDAEAVRAFCKGQIAHYKIPRHIRFVEGFPTTVTGKVQKFAMRKAMIEELDLVLEKDGVGLLHEEAPERRRPRVRRLRRQRPGEPGTGRGPAETRR
ncbi:AMP-binding protein [Phenylobacterium sp. J367]|uniref:AMP-binding protein n=1 Tax=Phenylobacterium sp. J367 TaxID=2898435 RepID=UPI002150BBDA|nr:AMP-binding protein [Phenylobacterium sp. J367]MCR5878600.1 AMP-binding protein [Phenylobacterium sp. J367]